jgi:hypothetical protein
MTASEYIKVTLLVKPGAGAERMITERLNAWFTDGSRQPPFEPGTLLHYSIHEEAD